MKEQTEDPNMDLFTDDMANRFNITKEKMQEIKKDNEKTMDKIGNDKIVYSSNLKGDKVYYRLTDDLFFNSSVSEKLVSNQQIKEWSIYEMDEFLEHIYRM